MTTTHQKLRKLKHIYKVNTQSNRYGRDCLFRLALKSVARRPSEVHFVLPNNVECPGLTDKKSRTYRKGKRVSFVQNPAVKTLFSIDDKKVFFD
jgi:hypothetical protein